MSESSRDLGSPFPLTKFLHPVDYLALTPELQVVDLFNPTNGHEHRRWEYAMALRALNTWGAQLDPQVPPEMIRALDVGGCGSPLAQILVKAGLGGVRVVDPSLETEPATLEGYLAGGGGAEAVVTCVSVLEHVPEALYSGFLEALARAVRVGGLLFLTADAREAGHSDDEYSPTGQRHLTDNRHFNWMRERIYDPRTWGQLTTYFCSRGFEPLGAGDLTYRGPQVYDYSFVSMALVKRR